jgi:hypothetical protein
MSARLVIHAEIETHEDITEAMRLYVQVNAENPFNLIRFRDHIVGMASALTQPKTEEEKPQPLEGATQP